MFINEKGDYCTCKSPKSLTTDCEGEFGYWYICCDCGKRIKGGFHYYKL